MKRRDIDNPDPAGPDIDQMTNTLDEGGAMFGAMPYLPPPSRDPTDNGVLNHPAFQSLLRQHMSLISYVQRLIGGR